jgi:hypothetical protein
MRGRDRPGHNFPNLKSEPEIPESAPEILERDMPIAISGTMLRNPKLVWKIQVYTSGIRIS